MEQIRIDQSLGPVHFLLLYHVPLLSILLPLEYKLSFALELVLGFLAPFLDAPSQLQRLLRQAHVFLALAKIIRFVGPGVLRRRRGPQREGRGHDS